VTLTQAVVVPFVIFFAVLLTAVWDIKRRSNRG
jgi:hypothetical protein